MSNDAAALIPAILAIAKQVAVKILAFWGQPDRLVVQRKVDNTLSTQVDILASEILYQQLQALTPNIPILSEEDQWPDFAVRSQWQEYWLVDPLDGTRGFIEGSEQFTINIALIENHQPVLGLIYVPVTHVCYYATIGHGAFKQQSDQDPQSIHSHPLDLTHIRVVLGRYHRSSLITSALAVFPDYQLLRVNSSLKIGLIAEGRADIYPRLGPTSEWDTAAGQCILQEAGGLLVDLAGNPLQYNATASLVNPEFLALGDPTQLNTLLEIIKSEEK